MPSSETKFVERKQQLDIPVEWAGRGDEPPELDEADEKILDRVWDEIGKEDGL